MKPSMKARKPQASPSGFHTLRLVNIEELKIISSLCQENWAYKTVAASLNGSSVLQAELYINHIMTIPALCMRENKDADQQRGNRVADQRLCFRYTG